jgi:hypothetical protein
MIWWASLISGIAILVTATDWRKGLLVVLVIGVLQDIFRKLTTGAPSYFVLWSVVIYSVVVLVAVARREVPHRSSFYLRDQAVRFGLVVFFFLIALQMINSMVRYSNPAIAILGGLFYFGPFIAMLVAISFIDSINRIRQFLLAYLLIFVPTCLTVYLSPSLADEFAVLRDVGSFSGSELIIYDVGTILSSNPGVLRVGEIAAWHAATCVCFLSILTMQSKSTTSRLLYALLILLMLGVIVLTGRRKMLVAISIFFMLQWGLMIWYGWGVRKVAMALFATAVVATGYLLLYSPSQNTGLYLQRSQTVYGSLDDRLELTGNLVKSAVGRSGILGLGAGSTSQGARYAGVKSAAGGSSEAGLGKIMAELGPLGFLILISLVILTGRKIASRLNLVRQLDHRLLVYQVSFAAFLMANFAAFAVASQLFSDLFVLIIIGTVAGFMIRIHNQSVDLCEFRSLPSSNSNNQSLMQ